MVYFELSFSTNEAIQGERTFGQTTAGFNTMKKVLRNFVLVASYFLCLRHLPYLAKPKSGSPVVWLVL